MYLCETGARFGGEGPKYGAAAATLFGLMSSKTFTPLIIVLALADTRSVCIQWRRVLVAPPVRDGMSKSIIMTA